MPASLPPFPSSRLPAIFPSLSDPQHSHVARRAGGETIACAHPPPQPPSPRAAADRTTISSAAAASNVLDAAAAAAVVRTVYMLDLPSFATFAATAALSFSAAALCSSAKCRPSSRSVSRPTARASERAADPTHLLKSQYNGILDLGPSQNGPLDARRATDAAAATPLSLPRRRHVS